MHFLLQTSHCALWFLCDFPEFIVLSLVMFFLKIYELQVLELEKTDRLHLQQPVESHKVVPPSCLTKSYRSGTRPERAVVELPQRTEARVDRREAAKATPDLPSGSLWSSPEPPR